LSHRLWGEKRYIYIFDIPEVKEEEARRDWKGQDNAAPDSSFLTVKEGKSFRLRVVFIFRSVFGYRQERKRIRKKEERSNETVQSARVRDRQWNRKRSEREGE